MKWLGKIRLLTYAAIVAIVVITYVSWKHSIPVRLTSPDTRPSILHGVWFRFEDSAALPEPFREAAPAVMAAVSKEGLNPDRYFIQLEYGAEKKELEFLLWDVGVFPLDPGVKGDPTGKCRTVKYDPERKAIIRVYGWQ
jgi:hypothetical protein